MTILAITMRKLITLVVVLTFVPSLCFGWGREGHTIISIVAEDHLDETTKVMIQSLIGNNHLYSVASWADDVRRDRPATKGWHYVNIPFGSKYDANRDCPVKTSCVVAQIARLREC